MGLLGRAPHRIAMTFADTVAHVHEIEMRVDLDDMNWTVLGESPDAGDVDAVIAS